MNRTAIEERIEDLRRRGIVSPQDEARIQRDLEQEKWADLELFLNQLEVEARFRSWRPIIRLAMLSSVISALILIAVAIWVGTQHPEIIQSLSGNAHETGN
jgi:hypothetical protein